MCNCRSVLSLYKACSEDKYDERGDTKPSEHFNNLLQISFQRRV